MHQEYDTYKNVLPIASSENPLIWWSKHHEQFPRLAKLAKAYLAIPATSVPSEQSFSKAGYITEKRRSKLSTDHVKEILFLHYNKNIVAKTEQAKDWDNYNDESDEDLD